MSHMPISFKLRPLILKELPGPGAECCGVHPLSPISCLFMTQRVGLDACMVGSHVANLVLCFPTWILRYLQLPGLPMTLSGLWPLMLAAITHPWETAWRLSGDLKGC